jgi:hypothetical protein
MHRQQQAAAARQVHQLLMGLTDAQPVLLLRQALPQEQQLV